MKCKNCGGDIFPGQFRCDICGAITAAGTEKPEKEATDKQAKDKK